MHHFYCTSLPGCWSRCPRTICTSFPVQTALCQIKKVSTIPLKLGKHLMVLKLYLVVHAVQEIAQHQYPSAHLLLKALTPYFKG